ncbi:uncharacterized protein LOC124362151 [Homalodisca vitripennis]|uniref:uncharacterized protein LOC124362151 n=1 Tax=Homalodisca vitripennis TaxID=197043 RepID=UPI001EEAA8F0|nr:uncharacterized protein LOC124362151 [Homalodisca vitripennis]
MPYYDSNSSYYRESTAGPLHYTYTLDRKCDFMIDRNMNKQDDYCNVLPERFNRKPPQISKLRTILSETITNVTKNNQLQKGESVELTLEIELMRTKDNTPTNSLVEVTIIQHNKSKEQAAQDCDSRKCPPDIPFQAQMKNSRSESPSEKRRNWFQRVITKPNCENIKKFESVEHKIQENPINHLKKNYKQNEDTNNSINIRSNFVTILPEASPLSIHYTKGYQRVSPSHFTKDKARNVMTPRKDSLAKKLSNIFLPTRNADKNHVVQTALTALKKEVDNMKLVIDKDKNNQTGMQSKKAPVHNLGKLVSNILVDAMENFGETNKSEGEADTLPVQYQSYFEPVIKPNDKQLVKTFNESKPKLKVKMIAESHSDTCCLKPIYTTSPSLQTSISMSDCRSLQEAKSPPETLDIIGDSTNIPSGDRHNKSIRENKYSRDQQKDAKGDASNIGKKDIPYKKKKKSTRTKKSVVNWGGHIIQVNKKKKSRIEHLIVKELQNLALKEGMECDVMPLPPIDNDIEQISAVGKISSFICELDVSDQAFEKEIKKLKPTDKTLHRPFQQSLERIQRFYTNNKGHITKQPVAKLKRTKKEKRLTSAITDCYESCNYSFEVNAENFSQKKTSDTLTKQLRTNIAKGKSEATYLNATEDNEVKVTYLNKNVKNWSAESNNIRFEKPTMECSRNSKTTSTETQTNKNNNINSVVSTGFVKVIKSDDSTWHRYLREQDESGSGLSTQVMTVTSTETAIKFHSGASNDFETNIELEVDIKDLELILKEAKKKQTTDRYVINAKWNEGNKKRKKNIRITGKNSPAYTNRLLSNAARKLENYVKIKQRQR